MNSYILAINIPSSVQRHLAQICYGIPNVNWLDSNDFYLQLRSFGQLSLEKLEEIQKCLNSLFFNSFSLQLKEIGHDHFKSQQGTIWVGANPLLELIELKNQINKLLKELKLLPERHSNLKVFLGHYYKVHSDRLLEYLMNHFLFQTPFFTATKCSLLLIKTTTKRTFMEVIEEYEAASPATGED
ncbi:hypothetical protein PRO82_001764 [Candidatus Protochlamydia amoebophila]|uniref:2'-5' RNA ligase family protein n=1 Tax=Candidatus Protochlamydia amoebophila TaxID=362787 RepID=UPI001BC9D72E|nr:hypothetical protein [Candidatus Protochlamydia amoebophila]MBS4164436.1 hypothetical protein [Candidatus Protochlamydia amoebophila]